jgi:hypothetical protein
VDPRKRSLARQGALRRRCIGSSIIAGRSTSTNAMTAADGATDCDAVSLAAGAGSSGTSSTPAAQPIFVAGYAIYPSLDWEMRARFGNDANNNGSQATQLELAASWFVGLRMRALDAS